MLHLFDRLEHLKQNSVSHKNFLFIKTYIIIIESFDGIDQFVNRRLKGDDRDDEHRWNR